MQVADIYGKSIYQGVVERLGNYTDNPLQDLSRKDLPRKNN